MEVLEIRSTTREELINITHRVQEVVSAKNWQDGALLLYCPHTTGAVTVNEGADPDVARDIVVNLQRIVPFKGDYKHMEGNSDAHIKASMFGSDQMLIVEGGRIQLGTWQSIYFCEFDGARTRKLWMSWLSK